MDALLRSLLDEIKETTGKIEEEIPSEPDKLRAALPKLLEAAGKRGKTILLLDGLNQLESGLNDLSLAAAGSASRCQAGRQFQARRGAGRGLLQEATGEARRR